GVLLEVVVERRAAAQAAVERAGDAGLAAGPGLGDPVLLVALAQDVPGDAARVELGELQLDRTGARLRPGRAGQEPDVARARAVDGSADPVPGRGKGRHRSSDDCQRAGRRDDDVAPAVR